MISQDVKNALLQSINDLVARIMAQAGMKEAEVSQLILNMFASTVEAIDPDVANKIVSPKTAALMAAKLLDANIGNAPEDYNSIEKIGTFIPELLQQLNDNLIQLAEVLRGEIAEAAEATSQLSDLLSKHGMLGALDLKLPNAVLSTKFSDLMALEIGSYTGTVKASQLGLQTLWGVCGGVEYDEELLLKIEHMQFDGIVHQVRTAYTGKGIYVASWNSTMPNTHNLMAGWQRPPETQLLLLRHDDTLDVDNTTQYDFIAQLEMASLPADLSGPYLEWAGSYGVHTDWMTGRQLTNDLIFWVSTKDSHVGRPGEWYILSNAVHSAGYSGDTASEWIARGAKVVASGTWLDFGAPDTDPDNVRWTVEVLSGQGMFYIHDMVHGEPLGATPSHYNGSQISSDFSVSVIAPYTESVPSVYKHELVMRITCMDVGTGKEHSRLLRLSKVLDNRIQQLPQLGTTVGTVMINHDPSVSAANDLIVGDSNLQLSARVVKEIGRISPFVGVLPQVDLLDNTIKTFFFPDKCVTRLELGVTLIPNMENPVFEFTSAYTVGLELTYNGVTREFEFINDFRLSERINGVLTGVDFEDVAYLVNSPGVQRVSIFCGKTTDAPVSMLETLFPGASNYVPATDASGGTSWFAHTGALVIKLTATPKDPLNVEDHLELSTAVYLTV